MYCTSPLAGRSCKNCMACRINHASQWAVRGSHERSMHDDACSITLTYSDEFVPWSGLQKKHLQDFFKRLRRQLDYYEMPGVGFKYMASGEYGDGSGKRSYFEHPHYHAVFFGLDFPDKYPWRKGKLGHQLYRSDFLEKQWEFGNCEIGGAEDEAINYVSSYILKKVNGKRLNSHYGARRFCDVMGNHFDFLFNQEFFLSSRRPAIGLKFLETAWDDIFSHDEVVIGGRRKPVPVYYMNKLRERSEILYQQIKRERKYDAVDKPLEADIEQLTLHNNSRKACYEAKMALYK